MRRRITLSAVLAACAVLLPDFACPALAAPEDARYKGGEFLAGVPANFPPDYSIDHKTGMPAGFAIDVMDEIAQRSGIKVRYVVYPTWTKAVDALAKGEVALIPNMGVIEERDLQMDFTSPVEAFNIVIFIRATTIEIKSLEDLRGKEVAVVEQNAGLFLMQKRGGSNLKIYSSQDEALLSLLSGKTDALVYSEPPLRLLSEKTGLADRIKIVGEPLLEIKRGIAVGKGNQKLLKKLDDAVKTFVRTPGYQEIYAKWHGKPAPYWNTRRIVSAAVLIFIVAGTGLSIRHYVKVSRINKELLESEKKYRTLHESMRDAFVSVDMQGHILEFNNAYLQMLGYTGAEIRGLTYVDIIPSRWHESEAKIVAEQILPRGYSDVYEKEYRKKDGTIIPVELRTFLIQDEAGRPAFMWAIVRDITERKLAEKTLGETENTLQTMIQTSPLAIIVFNPQGIVTHWNQAAERIFGWSATDVIGKPIPIIPPEKYDEVHEVRRQLLSGKTYVGHETERMRKDGARIMVSFSATALYGREGQITGILSIVADITDRTKIAEMIARQNRLYSVLSRVNEAIVRIREPKVLYQEICRITVEEGLFRMAWIGMVDPDTLLVQPVASHGHEDGYLARKRISVDEKLPEGRGPTGTAIRKGGYFVCNDIESDPVMTPWREEALRRGYRSSAAFAIWKAERIVGTLNVYAGTADFFREEEVQLLQRLVDDISYAIAAIESDRELTLSHDTLIMVLNSLDAVVYVADMKTYEVLYTNKYVTDIFGDVTGRICWQALQSGQTGPCPFCTNELLLDERGNPKGVYVWQFENAIAGRWFDIRDRAIRWVDGRTVRLEIAADITDRKKAEAELITYRDGLELLVGERTRELEGKTQQLGQSELALLNVVEDLNKAAEELRKANERLKELDRLKSLFIASMSHELRTPLNSIIGFSSIVLDEWSGPLNEEQKKELAAVKRSGKHLLSLINDVIDVSKVEAGTIEIAATDFDLHDLLTEAAEMFGKEIADKGLALRLDAPHLPLRTDRRRLLQCVVNLVGNAVKFTEQGGIGIVVSGAGDAVEIAVEDTGVGIKEEDLPKLFRSFVRLDSPLTTTVPGTGLGLYLTKKMVTEILKGEIMVESDYGKGSRFTMRIPTEAAS